MTDRAYGLFTASEHRPPPPTYATFTGDPPPDRRPPAWWWAVLAGLVVTAAALAAYVLLTARTSAGDGNPGPAAYPADVHAVASAVCDTPMQDTVAGEREFFVRESGTCIVGSGDKVTVYAFGTATAEDQWLQVASGFGGVYVVGHGWVVSVDTQAVAETVRGKVGGEIR
jgi:hypothetical protein